MNCKSHAHINARVRVRLCARAIYSSFASTVRVCLRSSAPLKHALRPHPHQRRAIKRTTHATSLFYLLLPALWYITHVCGGCFCVRVARRRRERRILVAGVTFGTKKHTCCSRGLRPLCCTERCLGVGVLMHASVSCHVTMSRGAFMRRRAVSMV